jgi:F420-dependent oxidoreductase-like protein
LFPLQWRLLRAVAKPVAAVGFERGIRMQVGIHVVSFNWPDGPEGTGRKLAEIAAASEAAGCASLSVMDHFFQSEGMIGPADDPMLEGYTTLGYLAALTSEIKLQLLVTGVTYRYPGVLAKIISTLDVLSGGRAEFGIGAAWYEREHVALGVPYPPVAERFERLEEAVQIVKQMWSGDRGAYDGEHYQLAETINVPQPLQQPHPPIMIGGGGEKKTLRLVAKYADACNISGGVNPSLPPDFQFGPDKVEHKLDVLRGHCEREGTDYDKIEKTMLYFGMPPIDPETAEQFVGELADYAALGITRVFVIPFGPDPVGFIENVGAHAIPALSD